jgi:hypothetical protein
VSDLPVIELPHRNVRTLTASECDRMAVEARASLAACVDLRTRRHLRAEVHAWERLAAERCTPNDFIAA